MKKNNNIFRVANMTTGLRVLTFFCVVIVAGSVVLLLSIPSVRQAIVKSWFGGNGSIINHKSPVNIKGEGTGLSDVAVVNNNNHVKPLTLDDHLWGNISAPVQLIIYEDFECPFCLIFYDTVARAKAEFGNDLVVAIRHFPIASHPNAMTAAIASECAAEQDKFFDMYNELFSEAKAGIFNNESIWQAGKKIGLDDVAYTACLTKKSPEAKIVAQKDEVKALGIGGTPASFINGDYYAGALPYDDFTHPDGVKAKGLRSLIKERLAKKQ